MESALSLIRNRSGRSRPSCLSHSFPPRIQPIKVRLSFSCKCTGQKCPPNTLLLLFDQRAVSLVDLNSCSVEVYRLLISLLRSRSGRSHASSPPPRVALACLYVANIVTQNATSQRFFKRYIK